MTRLDTSPGAPPAYNGPPFGDACATGSKALCCQVPGRVCRWDGTAPFCDGGCRNGETEAQPPPGSSGGEACGTGSKVYCCHSTQTGTGSSALRANPKWTRYAAYWEKGLAPAWEARHGLAKGQYQQTFDALAKYPAGRGHGIVSMIARLTPRWKSGRVGPVARHGLARTSQQDFKTLKEQGYRLVHISL